MTMTTNTARLLELSMLDLRARTRAPAKPPQLVTLNAKWAVWRIVVPGMAACFMRAESSALDGNSFAVMVDGNGFYRAWLANDNGTNRPDRCPLRADMPADRKFARAVEGFLRGLSSPVPLADVQATRTASGISVSFDNGVTRTLWLLANHAMTFPVHACGIEVAKLIGEVAGINVEPIHYEALFRNAKVKQREDWKRGEWESLGTITEP